MALGPILLIILLVGLLLGVFTVRDYRGHFSVGTALVLIILILLLTGHI